LGLVGSGLYLSTRNMLWLLKVREKLTLRGRGSINRHQYMGGLSLQLYQFT